MFVGFNWLSWCSIMIVSSGKISTTSCCRLTRHAYDVRVNHIRSKKVAMLLDVAHSTFFLALHSNRLALSQHSKNLFCFFLALAFCRLSLPSLLHEYS
jgi:hypothetical protein